MAITYVGGQTAGRANPSSAVSVNYALTGGLASVPAADDLVIVTCVTGSAAGTPAMAVTTPATWTALGQLNQSAATADTSMDVSYKFMPATPDTAVTIPGTGNNAFGEAYTIQVFRGVDLTNPLDVAAVSAGATGTGRPDPAAITPVTAGAVVVICGGGAAGTGANYTAPANFTTNFLTASGADTTDAMVGSGYWTGWTSGAVNPAAYTGGTTGGTDSWASYTLALRPAASDTTAPTLSAQTVDTLTTGGGTPKVTTDEGNGTAYMVVVANGDSPSVTQIKAGQNSSGGAALANQNQSVSGTGVQTFSAVTGLTSNTAYDCWFVHTDAVGNNSSAVKADFSTLFAFNDARQAIIDGLDSAQSETNGWDAKRSSIPVTAVARTSSTVVTITLPAIASYDITATETITATIPASALTGGSPIVASPTMTIAPATTDTITITTPTQYHTLQRNGSNQASIPITGTYTGTPTSIEASFNGGSYATIVASPAGGTYSGTLSAQAQGQGTLTVRFTNNTSISATKADIGIGERFIVGGDSIAEGRGASAQSYSHATLKGTVFRQDDAWANGNDPVDTGTSSGSHWPWMLTELMDELGVPVALVSCGTGSTDVAGSHNEWAEPNSAYEEMETQAGSVGDSTGFRGVLMHLGPNAIVNASTLSQATYNAALDTLASNIQTDITGTPKLLLALCGEVTTGTPPDRRAAMENIRGAILEAVGDNSNINLGPNLVDDDYSDGVHPSTTAQLTRLGRLWALSVLETFFSGVSSHGPRLTQAIMNPARTAIALDFDRDLASGTTYGGFRVTDSGTPMTITSATRTGTRTIEIVLSSAASAVANVALFFASENDAAGQTVPQSTAVTLPTSNTINLTMEPLIARAVSATIAAPVATTSWVVAAATVIAAVTIAAPFATAAWTVPTPSVTQSGSVAAPPAIASWVTPTPTVISPVSVTAPVATAAWTVPAAVVQSPVTIAAGSPAIATWVALTPTVEGAGSIAAPPAIATWVTPTPSVTSPVSVSAPVATASWVAPAAVVQSPVTITAPVAIGTWIAPTPTVSSVVTVTAPVATATWVAPGATVQGSGSVLAPVATAAWVVPTPNIVTSGSVLAPAAVATWVVPTPVLNVQIITPAATAAWVVPTATAARTIAAPVATTAWVVPAPTVQLVTSLTPAAAVASWVVPTPIVQTAGVAVPAPVAVANWIIPTPQLVMIITVPTDFIVVPANDRWIHVDGVDRWIVVTGE